MFKIVHYFFLGILFTLINININIGNLSFDLLPNTAGYILILMNFQTLSKQNHKFVTGSIVTLLNLIFHLIQVLGGTQLEAQGMMGLWVHLVVSILNLTYIYYIHEAVDMMIKDQEESSEWEHLQERNQTNWKWCLYLGIIQSVLIPFVLNVEVPFGLIMVIALIGSLIVEIDFLVILSKVKKMLLRRA